MPLDPVVADWLALGAAAISLVALVVAALALRRASRVPVMPRSTAAPPRLRASTPARAGAVAGAPARTTESDGLTGLREEVAALRLEVSDALRHLAVVRYDAFGDMGGHLSWSLALLDDAGNGMVLTSIHGRSDSRTYAKNVRHWTCEQQLSPEEAEAIDFARAERAG